MEWIMNNTELFARGNSINPTIKSNSLHMEEKRNESDHGGGGALFLSSLLWFNFKEAESNCSILRFQLLLLVRIASSQKGLLFANTVTYIVTFTILPSVISS